MPKDVFGLFSKPLRDQIEAFNWVSPTEIQELAFPEILDGENVLLIAPTGTGKTEAAVLPILELLIRRRGSEPPKGIAVLYITPLRALNRDIFRRLMSLGERLGIRVEVRHGDTPQSIRRLQASSPPEMLITTPETFQAILPGSRMRRHLSAVRWVVVDEVHELATDKRGAQLSVGLERLREDIGQEFQRIGLSATVGNPSLIARFLVGEGRTCKILRSLKSKSIEVTVESPHPKPEDEEAAGLLMVPAASISRIRRILQLISEHRSTLVFTNTREHAEALASRIRALKHGSGIGIHHGSLSKEARMETELALKEGGLRAVICTSSLELGIDIGEVDFVIQYMSPRQVTKLVQRVGRSGHTVEGRPFGAIVAAWPDDILESAVISNLAEQGLLEEPKIHSNALDVLAHQIAGLALEWGRIGLEDVARVVRRAWPYRETTIEELDALSRQLADSRIIWYEGKVIGRRLPRTLRYYYSSLSMIVDVKRYEVVDFLNNRKIGTLDQEFVVKSGKPGQDFVIHGQTWRIVGVDENKAVVYVEPAPHSFGAIPAWEGEIIPVPYEVAQRVGKLREEVAEKIKAGIKPDQALGRYRLTEEARAKVMEFINGHIQAGYPLPTDRRILVEGYENYIIVHACLGDLANEAIGKALASVISGRFGVNIGIHRDPYRIAFIAPIRIDPHLIKKEILALKPEELDRLIEAALEDTSLLAWRLWNVAKRFGIVDKGAEFTSSHGRILASTLRGTPIYREALREIYLEEMDLSQAKQALTMINEGRIEVCAAPRGRGYSPIALPILDRIVPQDILHPAAPTRAIIDLVKDRLDNSEVRLVCLLKADYNGVRVIRNLPERIRCPTCGSALVAATYAWDDLLVKAVRKKLEGRRLTPEEEKSWETAWRSASLVQTYGKKALIVMAGRGVGPTNAARILRSYHRKDEDLYLDIIRAERDYLRTRMFWSPRGE
jgi:ATP-dependent Lhr-like helicase